MGRIINIIKHFFDENRAWLKYTIGWFVVAGFIGAVAFFVKPDLLKTIVAGFQDRFGANPALDFHLAVQIFIQNVIASAIGLFGGLMLGLGPVLVIGVNGFLLGFVLASLVALNENFLISLGVIFGGILPHGIFELSAFFVAGGLGLRLGFEWLMRKSAGQRRGILKNNFIRGLKVFPFIAVALFVAAMIEVFISGRIVDNF